MGSVHPQHLGAGGREEADAVSPGPEGSWPRPGSQQGPAGRHQPLPMHLPCVGFAGAAPTSSHTRAQKQGAQVQLVLTEQTKGSTG